MTSRQTQSGIRLTANAVLVSVALCLFGCVTPSIAPAGTQYATSAAEIEVEVIAKFARDYALANATLAVPIRSRLIEPGALLDLIVAEDAQARGALDQANALAEAGRHDEAKEVIENAADALALLDRIASRYPAPALGAVTPELARPATRTPSPFASPPVLQIRE